jgi:hypothetical protein
MGRDLENFSEKQMVVRLKRCAKRLILYRNGGPFETLRKEIDPISQWWSV